MNRLLHSIRFLCSIVILLLTACIRDIYSQCPPIANTVHFADNAKIYCDLSKISDPLIKGQIQTAINNWNSVMQSNGSGIQLEYNSRPQNATASTPIITFVIGGSNGSNFGDFNGSSPIGSNAIVSATITFYTGGIFPDGSNLYDPGKPGYNTIFTKMTLHELGHGMDLGHPSDPQSPGATVMNDPMGTNDSWARIATTVQPCDKNAVNSVYGSGGGGGGGGGGVNNPPGCTPTYVQRVIYINDTPIPVGDPVYAGCL